MATNLKDAFAQHLAPEQAGWVEGLAPTTIHWPDGKKVKLNYPEEVNLARGEAEAPEAQVKLHECFQLRDHPFICEGTLPVKFWLCGPDGKRLEATFNWPAFKTNQYPKLKSTLQKKYPGVGWL